LDIKEKVETRSTEAFKSENHPREKIAQLGGVFDIAIDESGELRDKGRAANT
jgi:hypothetical protein